MVAAALCIVIASWGTYYAFGVFFKPVLTEFGWTRAMTSGAFSLAMIVQGLIGIVVGGLTDRLGPRIVLTLCGFLLGLGYLLMSQIGTVWQLYLFYWVIVGTGMSGATVPLLSTVARWFAARRSLMTAIVLTGTGIGLLIAPPVANWLISIYDWHVSYLILGGVLLVVIILAAQFLRYDPTQIGQRPYGENKGTEQWLKLRSEGLSLMEAVYTRQFWVVFVMFLCTAYSRLTVMVHIAPHATDLGISAATAASILATIGIMDVVGRIVLGSAADRIGNRQVFIIGFALMSASFLWLVPATEVWMLYLFAVVFGFAHAGAGASMSPLVAWLFGLRSHGLIFGVANIGLTIGGAIGPLLAGYLFDVTGSYQLSFFICAALCIVGLILTVLLAPIRGERG